MLKSTYTPVIINFITAGSSELKVIVLYCHLSEIMCRNEKFDVSPQLMAYLVFASIHIQLIQTFNICNVVQYHIIII